MATLSELANAVADAEGMDRATVALIARYVREEGFIQKKGRGSSAAQMGIADAANLLIGVNASGAARDAPNVVRVYRGLIAKEEKYEWEPRTAEEAEAQKKRKKRTPKILGSFGEALEIVIESAIQNQLPQYILSIGVSDLLRKAFEQGNASISIGFNRPEPKVYISISIPPKLEEIPGFPGQFHFPPDQRDRNVDFSFYPQLPSSRTEKCDRSDETTIGKLTIFSVANMLRSSLQLKREAG